MQYEITTYHAHNISLKEDEHYKDFDDQQKRRRQNIMSEL